VPHWRLGLGPKSVSDPSSLPQSQDGAGESRDEDLRRGGRKGGTRRAAVSPVNPGEKAFHLAKGNVHKSPTSKAIHFLIPCQGSTKPTENIQYKCWRVPKKKTSAV
jgi:hypothetical protein